MERIQKACQPWMARSDMEIWNLVTGQEVARGIHVNPTLGCPSCGRDVYRFGNYPWKVSLDRPWMIECPSCGEVWPRNDFAAFHRSGLGVGGVFRRSQADESLLYNAEHPDPADPLRGYAADQLGLASAYGDGLAQWHCLHTQGPEGSEHRGQCWGGRNGIGDLPFALLWYQDVPVERPDTSDRLSLGKCFRGSGYIEAFLHTAIADYARLVQTPAYQKRLDIDKVVRHVLFVRSGYFVDIRVDGDTVASVDRGDGWIRFPLAAGEHAVAAHR